MRREARRNRDGEILRAAVDLFGRKGYAATTIQDIAEAVGVLKGSVYHYVSSKEDLLFEICDRWYEQAGKILTAAEAGEGPPLPRLRGFVEEYVAYCLQTVERMRVFTREGHHLSQARRDELGSHRRGYEEHVESLLREAAEQGEIDSTAAPATTAHFIFGAINGLPDWYREGGPLRSTEIAERYASMATAATAVDDHQRKRGSR
jgi:AcrR family transcriptional regulator